MKTIEEILAENIKTRRKALKMSQRKLAESAGVSEDTIIRAEKARQTPQRPNLISIARALGCTPEDLFINKEQGMTLGQIASITPEQYEQTRRASKEGTKEAVEELISSMKGTSLKDLLPPHLASPVTPYGSISPEVQKILELAMQAEVVAPHTLMAAADILKLGIARAAPATVQDQKRRHK